MIVIGASLYVLKELKILIFLKTHSLKELTQGVNSKSKKSKQRRNFLIFPSLSMSAQSSAFPLRELF